MKFENKLKNELMDEIKAQKNNRDTIFWKPDLTDVHISDSVYCSKQRIQKKIQKTPTDDETERVFYIGNNIEDMIQDFVLSIDSDVVFNHKKSIEINGLNIKGEADGLDYKNNMIYEIKSTSYLPKEPKEHHLNQIYGYSYLFSDIRQTFNQYRLIYVDKKNYNIKVFEDNITEKEKEKYIKLENQYIEQLEQYLKADKSFENINWNNKAVPRYKWECKYCNFSERCKFTGVDNE